MLTKGVGSPREEARSFYFYVYLFVLLFCLYFSGLNYRSHGGFIHADSQLVDLGAWREAGTTGSLLSAFFPSLRFFCPLFWFQGSWRTHGERVRWR